MPSTPQQHTVPGAPPVAEPATEDIYSKSDAAISNNGDEQQRLEECAVVLVPALQTCCIRIELLPAQRLVDPLSTPIPQIKSTLSSTFWGTAALLLPFKFLSLAPP